jgi:hypothetical protein
MPSKPSTLTDLFKFYHDYVKLLYSSVQVENHLPFEVLFELNAALDHLSRHWVCAEKESQVVEKAYSHLKRSCLDIFKIKLKQTVDQYNELKKCDTSIIDNGKFELSMHTLIYNIKQEAIHARQQEGNSGNDDEDSIKAFDLWEPVFNKCVTFEKTYYLNENLDWASTKSKQYTKNQLIFSVLGSFVAGLFISCLPKICTSISTVLFSR